MTFTLRIATRDWDYLTPLLLGDIASDRLELRIKRVGTLIWDLGSSPDFDAAEMFMSRFVSAMAAGAQDVVGLPCFIMRGFRHRCIITTEASPLEHLSQLRGKRIGVTGSRNSAIRGPERRCAARTSASRTRSGSPAASPLSTPSSTGWTASAARVSSRPIRKNAP